MAMSDVENAKAEPLAIWTIGFRPFFLMAGIWSAVALAGWIAVLTIGLTLPSRFDPLTWHIHEMLFGFVLAAIAGFLLTAIPNWTGRPPISGRLLAALVMLWFAGRVTCLVSAWFPLGLAAAIDLAFPFVLCGVVAREIIAGRNWRNMIMPIPVAMLGVADLLMYLELSGSSLSVGLGWRLGLAAIIVLISVVGGRIIPSFTRNWLIRQNASRLPPAHGHVDSLALVSLLAGMIGWALFPERWPFGWLLLVAAALNLWRLGRWRGPAVGAEPLLTILHAGYLWVIIGAALLGASMLADHVPQAAAIHALTAGAIGTMTLGVMTRVSLGHTGRALTADRITGLIYLLVILAAIARVAAWDGGSSAMLIEISAVLWIGSFGLFVLRYGPILLSPRVKSVDIQPRR
ncbi:NnrS [Nitrobacter winogradskyi Nb-255]|uniref:NnrS n=1 Tax=Nitrobacter winogradskyi (strain ATCC 25391 / DSM 10237 / CIP 104748 / NCIMB 11846 / Nb-255) TaxID=323098 RepID=Q3SV67_NITWN|nr:NnrS family protein [Nitrobacter winogradskyi]ABA03824.1 NnrS [Nitrobacter winogradskyi Nb-255]